MANGQSTTEPVSSREVTITRVFGVPARILFEAHSKPEYLREWFGPRGYPLTLCEMDFRVGGKYRFALKDPDGALMTSFSGEYREIVKDEKIYYSSAMDVPGAETMVVTITFVEKNGKTTLTHHTVFASIAMKEKHVGMGYEKGVGSALKQLEESTKDRA